MKFGVRILSLKRRIAAGTSWKSYLGHSPGLVEGIPSNKTGIIIRNSSKALTVTGKNFIELRTQITDIYNRRVTLQKQLSSAKLKYYFLSFAHFLSYLLIFGFFYNKFAIARENQHTIIENIEKKLPEIYISLTFADKIQLEKSWLNCIDTYNKLMKSERIWDMTNSVVVDRAEDRTIADSAINRKEITPSKGNIEFVKSDMSYLFFHNANGADLYVYPTFLLQFKDNKELDMFDLKVIKTGFEITGYIEEEKVPKDTVTIQFTWKKANKDGSQDKRFKGNYQIPVVKYGHLTFESESGLAEYYMFSNFAALSDFKSAYKHHFELLKKL